MIKEFKKFENSSQDEEYNKEKEEKVEEAIQKLDLLINTLIETDNLKDEIYGILIDYNVLEESNEINYCFSNTDDELYYELRRLKKTLKEKYKEWLFSVYPERKEADKFNF